MFRFFINKKIDSNHFEIDAKTLKHMKVSRVFKERFICIFKEHFYICELENNSAKIIEPIAKDHEFKNPVIVAACIINIKRFEWMIQKAAELGATKIIPIYSKRVVNKIGPSINHKIERWNQIALNASEQSFRNKPLEVTNPIEYKDVIKLKVKNKFIAHEQCSKKIENIFPDDSIFLIGPEGGFTDEEIKASMKAGFKAISLGKRILRSETAALFVLSRINQ